VAGDYAWFDGVADLRKGYCFVWVGGLKPLQALERVGGKELERVAWRQLVGSGDGQRGITDRYFFGVARVDTWSLLIEDNGSLGLADQLLSELSVGTQVIANYRESDGHGRFLVMADRVVQLEFDPAADDRRLGTRASELGPAMAAAGFGSSADAETRQAASFALAERLTGVPMTLDFLRERTYLFSSAPRG
jgi:hypothetical protein